MPLETMSRPARVDDIMTHALVSVNSSTTARQLARIFIDHNISGAPVVNGEGRLVGVVSKTDLLAWCVRGGLGFGAMDPLRQLAEGGQGTAPHMEDLGIVADFMSDHVFTTTRDEPLDVVAHRMANEGVHRLIVVTARTGGNGQHASTIVGIITSFDLLKAYPTMMR